MAVESEKKRSSNSFEILIVHSSDQHFSMTDLTTLVCLSLHNVKFTYGTYSEDMCTHCVHCLS